jgi:hypothetical protein
VAAGGRLGSFDVADLPLPLIGFAVASALVLVALRYI